MKNILFAATMLAELLSMGCAQAKSASYICDFHDQGVEFIIIFDADTIFTGQLGRAVIVGKSGTSDVIVHFGSSAITFIEALKTGVTQTTTIELITGISIHSRHSLSPQTSKGERHFIPSQSIGYCRLNK